MDFLNDVVGVVVSGFLMLIAGAVALLGLGGTVIIIYQAITGTGPKCNSDDIPEGRP